MSAKTLSYVLGTLAVLAASQSLAAPPAAPAPSPSPKVVTPGPAPAQVPASTKMASSPAVFPAKVNPKYASQSAGQGRMHTCLDQYHANKAANANGGMEWIQKGGGYYSVCSKKLKG